MSPRHILQQSIRLVPWRLRNIIKSLPLVAPTQRWLLSRFLEGREFIHTVDAGPARGLLFPVVLPEDKSVWTGTYESNLVTELSEGVDHNSVCFDVGGWRGYCGAAMAVSGAQQVVIFEPLPENCARIRRLIELNPRLPIRLVQAAAGKCDGSATFSLMDQTSMGKLTESSFQRDVESETSITVDVVSLDSWCFKNDIAFPKVVKIDVEGAEIMVLEGARRTLESSRPKLLIEAHSHELAAQVVGFLSELDYSAKTLETGKPPDGSSEPEVCHILAVPR